MRRNDDLNAGEVLLWVTAGAAAGLVAGFALSAWVGTVNRPRLQRAAERLQQPKPPMPTTAAAGARAAAVALRGEPSLHDYALEALAVSPGVVELRGWVGARSARAVAARVVRAVPGIENVINSILVRGEDDRHSPPDALATDQPA